MDIVDDMKFSNFLADNFRVSYVGYITIRKPIMKDSDVLRFQIDLCEEVPRALTLGLMYPDDLSLCILHGLEILLII